jgi:glycosyltransferase involved in cell wall biosynthesis
MKIVVISEWFSDAMGYAENFLPRALGKLGHEVHVVTTDLQVYATSKDYEKVYQNYLGPKQVKIGIFEKEFFHLHRNPHTLIGGLGIMGLENKINEIRPHVVYCFEIFNRDTKILCSLKSKYGYILFCESRMHLSTFSPPSTPIEKLRQYKLNFSGRLMSRKIDQFYPIAPDVFDVIVKYFGIPEKKCKLTSLAVNTDLFSTFHSSSESNEIRKKFGYSEDDIVCLYTGRFTESKGPLVLAQAIDFLHRSGHTRFKGFFVGLGEGAYTNMLAESRGCKTHPFVNVSDLAKLYQSFDIGVWPLQESTSQLDAAACGLPIIINEKVQDNFRTDGNGLRYIDRDFKDLANKILSLQDRWTRKKMGKNGSDKILKYYTWDHLAVNKVSDFHKFLDR